MKLVHPNSPVPDDAAERKAIRPVICYPPDTLPKTNIPALDEFASQPEKTSELLIEPRDAGCIEVEAGRYFRIVSVNGPQVGDLNLWSRGDLNERFYSGKTRALHGTHLSTGDKMWSSFPYLRPMASITADTLDWYGFDEFGGSVHDVIGTRCDPYTAQLLSGIDYHHCCHSNLTRALANYCSDEIDQVEHLVHDVLNVFMCTGFTRDTGQYFMKASPVRPGDFLEFRAEIDLVVGLSACPGGDCSSEHSSDVANCYPLLIEVFDPGEAARDAFKSPERSKYDRSHGINC